MGIVMFDQKLDEHQTVYRELMDNHEKLVSSHYNLAGLHTQLAGSHEQGLESAAQVRCELESLLASERDTHMSELTQLKASDDAHQAQFDDIEKSLQGIEDAIGGIEEALHLNHTHFENKHYDADSKHKEINQIMEERFDVWETKLANMGQCVEANILGLDAFKGESSKAMSEMNQRFLEAHELLLQKTGLESQAINQQSSSALKEEFSQQCGKITEMQGRLSEHILEVDTKCDRWKNEFTKTYEAAHSQLDRTITARLEAAVNNSSTQINKTILGIKKEADNVLHDLQSRIDELRINLVQEGKNHAKWMDEERAAFRKVHNEHVHIVEVERDNRLRQMQELRMDLTKAMKDADNKLQPQFLSQKCGRTYNDTSSILGVAGVGSSAGSSTKLSSLLANLKAAQTQ